MATSLEDLLAGSDEEEEEEDQQRSLSHKHQLDTTRLQHLLNDYDEEEERSTAMEKGVEGNINDLISSLEIEDMDRYSHLESTLSSQKFERKETIQKFVSTENVIERELSNVNMIDLFDKQMKINENVSGIQANDLEWDTEGSTELTPSDIATPDPISLHEEEEEYSYDCVQLKDRLNEIDKLLASPHRDLSADRSLLEERLTVIDSLGCVKDISASPTVTSPQELTFGRRVFLLHPKDKGFAYLLRPDIRAENVLNLLEQILLSIGGSVLHPPEGDKLRYLQFQPLSTSSSWSSISCHLTTNHKKQRALVLIITPAPGSLVSSFGALTTSQNSTSSFLLSSTYPYSMHSTAPPAPLLHLLPSPSTTGYSQLFIDAVYEIYSIIALALYDESMTLYTLQSTSKLSTNSPKSTFTPMDSLVDPYHVRELYDTYFKELEDNVHLMSKSLLESIEQIEKQCARLMTLLRPIYDRCRIPLPSPPTKSPDIAHFLDPIVALPATIPASALPLSISSSSTRSIECTLEMSRLIILRARRLYKQQLEVAPQNHPRFNSYQLEITQVLRFIYHDILTTITRYQDLLTAHRTQIIHDRTHAIDYYKTHLILSLKSREISSSEDSQIFKQFQEKFRVITTSEPYLYDVKVCYSIYPYDRSLPPRQAISTTSTGIPIFSAPPTYASTIQSSNNRNGVLYITYSNLYFASYDLFLLSSIQRVIPIDSIARIGIIRATLIASDAISIDLENFNPEKSMTEQIVFYIASSTPFYVDRVIDLILWVREIRRKQASSSGEDGILSSGRAEGDRSLDVAKEAKEENSIQVKDDNVISVVSENESVVTEKKGSHDLDDGDKPPSPSATLGGGNNKARGIQAKLSKLQQK